MAMTHQQRTRLIADLYKGFDKITPQKRVSSAQIALLEDVQGREDLFPDVSHIRLDRLKDLGHYQSSADALVDRGVMSKEDVDLYALHPKAARILDIPPERTGHLKKVTEGDGMRIKALDALKNLGQEIYDCRLEIENQRETLVMRSKIAAQDLSKIVDSKGDRGVNSRGVLQGQGPEIDRLCGEINSMERILEPIVSAFTELAAALELDADDLRRF